MRTRFSLRLSPFTSFPFSQARKHNWPEYSLWDHGPTCIVCQVICLGPRSHLRHRSGYLPGTTVPPASSVRLSVWDHGPTCVIGQVICLGPRSHLHRRHIISLGQRLSNACHEQVLACRQQPVERSNHAAGRLLQVMVKALLGSERSMLSEICKISRGVRLNFKFPPAFLKPAAAAARWPVLRPAGNQSRPFLRPWMNMVPSSASPV